MTKAALDSVRLLNLKVHNFMLGRLQYRYLVLAMVAIGHARLLSNITATAAEPQEILRNARHSPTRTPKH